MIVVPTSGQLQIPGSFQSYARIFVTPSENANITRVLTVPGEPERFIPDAGLIFWRYAESGVSRYGQPLPITMAEQFIFTDYPQLEIDQLMVVLRFGVNASVSIRRKAV